MAASPKEDGSLTQEQRRHTLAAAGLLHPRPESVVAQVFVSGSPFFFALDKVQVKYEMLRAHAVEGRSVVTAAAEFGFSRETYYTVLASFQARGVPGLADGKPGRPGPLKLTDEAAQWVWELHRSAPDLSGRAIADRLAEELGVEVHRRSIERLLRGGGKKNG